MDRLGRNVLGFALGFFLMVALMLSAYASTATSPDGTVTFHGDTCAELAAGVLRTHAIADPVNPVPWQTLLCSADPVLLGTTVKMFWRDQSTSGSFNVDVTSVTQSENEGGYLGFVLLSLSWGVGLLAGLQR